RSRRHHHGRGCCQVAGAPVSRAFLTAKALSRPAIQRIHLVRPGGASILNGHPRPRRLVVMPYLPMDWLLVATGFSGAFTLVYLARMVRSWFVPPASHTVHFSPKGGCTEAVVAELRQARREVLVLAYSFTSKPIAQALVDAKLRGISVEIV